MKNLKFIFLFISLFAVTFIDAQKINSYRDIFKYYQRFYSLTQVQAYPDGESFSLVDSLENLVLFNNGKYTNLLSQEQLKKVLRQNYLVN